MSFPCEGARLLTKAMQIEGDNPYRAERKIPLPNGTIGKALTGKSGLSRRSAGLIERHYRHVIHIPVLSWDEPARDEPALPNLTTTPAAGN